MCSWAEASRHVNSVACAADAISWHLCNGGSHRSIPTANVLLRMQNEQPSPGGDSRYDTASEGDHLRSPLLANGRRAHRSSAAARLRSRVWEGKQPFPYHCWQYSTCTPQQQS